MLEFIFRLLIIVYLEMVMTELLLLRQALVVAMLAVASYTDVRKGMIFDWLTIPMIATGILLNAAEGQLLGIVIGAIVFIIGYAVYYAGKIGGGDVKMYTAAAMLLPFYGNELFVIGLVLVSSIASVVLLSTYFLARYFPKGIRMRENMEGIQKALLMGAAILLYLAATVHFGLLRKETALLLGVPAFFGLLYVGLEKGIRKEFFLKTVKLSELEEDEIVALDFLDEKTKKELGMKIKGVLGKKEIEKLKQAGIKEVPVYRRLPPFAPFTLIGAIITFLYPGIIRMIIGI